VGTVQGWLQPGRQVLGRLGGDVGRAMMSSRLGIVRFEIGKLNPAIAPTPGVGGHPHRQPPGQPPQWSHYQTDIGGQQAGVIGAVQVVGGGGGAVGAVNVIEGGGAGGCGAIC
jgi:hypothetical protein